MSDERWKAALRFAASEAVRITSYSGVADVGEFIGRHLTALAEGREAELVFGYEAGCLIKDGHDNTRLERTEP